MGKTITITERTMIGPRTRGTVIEAILNVASVSDKNRQAVLTRTQSPPSEIRAYLGRGEGGKNMGAAEWGRGRGRVVRAWTERRNAFLLPRLPNFIPVYACKASCTL